MFSRTSASLFKQSRFVAPNAHGLMSQSMRSVVVGIDLGTTNSACGVFEANQAKIIVNSEGHRTTPSIVAFHEKSGRLVGTPAKNQALVNPKSTFYATKRLIGRRFDDQATKEIAKHLSYEVVKGDNGDAWVYCPLENKKYSPSQIASFILSKLKASAEDYMNGRVNQAVITVPAYFNDSQRQATKDAGQIAGLEVLRVINEPTAAALAYGLGSDSSSDPKKDGTVAIYDLGGGTFDISILSLSDGVFEVMATNGDTTLGGEDFDNAMVDYILSEYKRDTQIDLKSDILAVQRIRECAEKAKCDLSINTNTKISAPYISADTSGAKHLDMEISRLKFEQLTDKLVQRTIAPCEQCLKDSDVSKNDITDVILVGGQTRMPMVQSVVEKFFNKKPSKSVNPDEVVAMGAAIQGGVLDGGVDGLVLIDVTPLSLGIETLGGIFTRLIEKNTAIPTKKGEVFSTAADNQTQVGIKVYQGERDMAADNKFLGHFDLVGIPPAPRGRPQIEVTFDIDANGILHVGASDKGTGKEQAMQIQTSGGLSKEEIEKMQKEAEAMAAADKEKKELAELTNSANTTIWQCETQMDEHKDIIDDELRNQLNNLIEELRTNLSKGNKEGIKSGCEQLNKCLSKIGEKIYGAQQSQQSQSNQQSSDEQGNDAKDADYNEKKEQ